MTDGIRTGDLRTRKRLLDQRNNHDPVLATRATKYFQMEHPEEKMSKWTRSETISVLKF